MSEKTITSSKNNILLSSLASIAVITIMIFLSEITGEKEIIFPEIAAISVGSFLSPQKSWNVNHIRMILTISLCAVLGVLIVLFVPFPLWIQVLLAYVVGHLIFSYSGTSFAPMISAIVLPVLIQTKSPVYIIAAISLTVFICILRQLLVINGIKTEPDFIPLPNPDKNAFKLMLIRIILVAAISFVFLCLIKEINGVNVRFCMAPPLLVAFTELSKPGSKAIKNPHKVILLISLCGLIGSVSRLIFCTFFGLPLTMACVIATTAMIALLYSFKLFLPPAGAICILAMLIPEEALIPYSVEILAGISILVFAAYMINKSDI
ncbi:MAG: HPP family protein [Butyrivibrio sp.]|nr:HPP family protein [Butyrivibrio sp.]